MSKKNKNKNNNVSKTPKGFEEAFDMDEHKPLRRLPSYVGYQEDTGKEVYLYSNGMTWIDFSSKQKKQIRLSPQGIFIIILAFLLSGWFLTSFIYRMCTEPDRGAVALSMLPSFIIVGACVAILLISYFGAWGKFVRWGYRHNLIRGRDAVDKKWHKEMRLELQRADLIKNYETAIEVTQNFVTLYLVGQVYVFRREAVVVSVSKSNCSLNLVFTIDGFEFEFPKVVDEKQYVNLKKVFRERMTTVKAEAESKPSRFNFVKELPAIIVAVGIVTAAVLMILAHYLWIPEIPPLIGIFFLLMSLLVFCNIFSCYPVIDELGVPFSFSLVLLVFPPMAYVWIETEAMKIEITFFHLLTHCSWYAAGFGFFWVMGFYVLSFAISRAVDYARFGRN